MRDRCPKTECDEYKDYMGYWLKHDKSRQRILTYAYPDRRIRNVDEDDNEEEEDDDDDENGN